ncbi:hypothetical protein ABPG75_006324 [Micractinium tetrahymenae]
MAAVSTAGSGTLCLLLPGQLAVPRGGAAWALLGSTGLIGVGVQVLNTKALKLSKAAPTIAMSYFAVVWSLLADLALFHHRPSPLSLLGVALVCASSLLIVLEEKHSSSGSSSDGSSSRDADSDGAALQLKAKQSGSYEVAAAAIHGQQQRGRGRVQGSGGSSQQLELAEGGALAPASSGSLGAEQQPGSRAEEEQEE